MVPGSSGTSGAAPSLTLQPRSWDRKRKAQKRSPLLVPPNMRSGVGALPAFAGGQQSWVSLHTMYGFHMRLEESCSCGSSPQPCFPCSCHQGQLDLGQSLTHKGHKKWWLVTKNTSAPTLTSYWHDLYLLLSPWSCASRCGGWLCLISPLETGDETEPVCVPLCSVLCDPGSLFTLLPVHLQPPSCSTVCVLLAGCIPPTTWAPFPTTWAPFPTQHITWGIFWGHDSEGVQRKQQSALIHSLPLIHSEDIFQNLLMLLTSVEFYRNVCQFSALSAFCSCTSLSMGFMLMSGHAVVSPSIFVWLSCAPELWTGWHRAGCSAGLGFGHSPAALSKERRASPVRTCGRSPQNPSPFPQPHVRQNFGVKSHRKAGGPLPSWLPHSWRYGNTAYICAHICEHSNTSPLQANSPHSFPVSDKARVSSLQETY